MALNLHANNTNACKCSCSTPYAYWRMHMVLQTHAQHHMHIDVCIWCCTQYNNVLPICMGFTCKLHCIWTHNHASIMCNMICTRFPKSFANFWNTFQKLQNTCNNDVYATHTWLISYLHLRTHAFFIIQNLCMSLNSAWPAHWWFSNSLMHSMSMDFLPKSAQQE